jgi:copper(I)-binding protein
MLGKRALGLLVLIFIAWSVQSPVTAARLRSGGIQITRPWIRATPEGASTAAAYLTIANETTRPDRLLSGSAPGVESILPHSMSMTGGIMRMRVLAEGLDIPPRGAVTLAPGGDHLMLTGLKQGLRAGQALVLRLKFARAGEVRVRVPVLAAAPPSTGALGGMKMR